MTGVVGALVALAVLLALVLVLMVRPHAQRLARTAAEVRADTEAALDRLRAARPARRAPSATVRRPSSFGDRGRHRRTGREP
jgi:hypothetical protein